MAHHSEKQLGTLAPGRRESLLREAASFIAKAPDANMEEIAQALGLGRATLHRHMGRRADLIATLVARAEDSLREAATRADLTGDNHVAALHRLIEELQQGAPYLAMLYEIHVEGDRTPESDTWGDSDRLIQSFFDRGQQAGSFAPGLTAAWLTEALYGLIVAAEWSVQAGRCARGDIVSMVRILFTQGAVTARHRQE